MKIYPPETSYNSKVFDKMLQAYIPRLRKITSFIDRRFENDFHFSASFDADFANRVILFVSFFQDGEFRDIQTPLKYSDLMTGNLQDIAIEILREVQRWA